MDRNVKGGCITFNAQRACEIVRKVGGRWYRTDELPRLPLKECTYGGICECKYKFYNDPRGPDRRKAHDRRVDLRFEMDHEDRRKRGRRSSDGVWKIDN